MGKVQSVLCFLESAGQVLTCPFSRGEQSSSSHAGPCSPSLSLSIACLLPRNHGIFQPKHVFDCSRKDKGQQVSG